MYLNAKIQSSFSYIWCRVCPAHQRSAPGLGLSGCPHKWNTYGNLPQWSAGLGDQRSQNINTLFSIKSDLDLDIFYKYWNQTWYLPIKFLDHSFWCRDITVKALDSQLLWVNGFEIVFNQSKALIFTYYLIFDQMYRFDLFAQKKNYTLSAKNRRESFPRPAVATFASNLTSDSNFPCQILYVPLSYLFEDCISAEGKWLKLNLLPRTHPTSVKVKKILISCPAHATCLINRTSGTCAASSEQAPQVRTFEHLGAPRCT